MGKKIQYIGKYNMDEVPLGKGNFARVELATHQITEIKVAIKVIDTKKIKEDYIRQNLHREAKIMSKLRHPNIIRLYETMKAQTLYCLVLEYAAGGELLAYIKCQENSRLAESEARGFVRQLVSALHYLHEKNVVHRDLKMENIMLDEKKKSVKLIDFGLSNTFKPDEQLRTHCGSPEYAAPELFVVGKTYGSEVDIWSLGIVIYAIVIGKLPFFTPYKDEYQRQRMQQQIQKGLSSYHDREMQILHSECRNLLHQILEPNPEARITLYDIVKHPWITKNGRYPFSPYVQPPKDKQLRHQSTAELAIMTGHKRMMVEETVKEHKADELSAMFNMLMDKKKKQRGMFDVDHTYKRGRHERESRSRSRDREKIVVKTPDSAKGKEIKGKMLKKGINKAKLNNVSRPSSLGTPPESLQKTVMSPSKRPSTPSHGPNLANIIAPPSYHSLSTQPPSRSQIPHNKQVAPPPNPNTLAVPSPTLNRPPESNSNNKPTTVPLSGGGGSGAAPTTGTSSAAMTNPPPASSKIPFSQRSNPPAKLNMTLDLSVTSTPKRQRPQLIRESEEDWDRLHKQVGASVGIAASSGVRPKVSTSPKETKEGKIPVGTPSKKGSNVCSPSRSSDGGGRKPLRPSTLWYIRTSLEKVRRRIPSASDSHHKNSKEEEEGGGTIEDCDVDDCDSKETLAPKATPEDSLIDFLSPGDASFDNGDRGVVGGGEEESAETGAWCGGIRDVANLVVVKATVEEVPIQGYVLNTSVDSVVEEQEQQPVETVLTNRLDEGIVRGGSWCGDDDADIEEEVDEEEEEEEVLEVEVGEEQQPSKAGEGLIMSSSPKQQLLSLDVKQKEPTTKQHSAKQLSFEVDQNYDSSTSSQNSVGMCPVSHVHHNLTGSGTSIPLRFQFTKHKPSDLRDLSTCLPNSGSEPLSVGVTKHKHLQEGEVGCGSTLECPLPATLSFSNPGHLDNTHLGCQTCGLSPDSPTYWNKHTRFSHSGAHALDVFTSPDEVPSPTDAFWEPALGGAASGGEFSPGIYSRKYKLPKVGADTPRIPMQLPVASMELFDRDALRCSPECNKEELEILSNAPCPEKCPQTIHIETTEVCKAVDKPPTNPNRARSPKKAHCTNTITKTSPCSKGRPLCISHTEAVYTPVPDTSLRLEPVGGSSESLDERVQGDGCTEKIDRNQCTNSTPHITPQSGGQYSHRPLPGDEGSGHKSQCPGAPTDLVKTSVRAAKKQMRNLLQWEKRLMKTEHPKRELAGETTAPMSTKQGHRTLTQETDTQCSLSETPEKKKEGSKFLHQYSPRSKLHSWKQGVSHLLSKSRPGTANNFTSLNNRQQSNKTTNTSEKNRANSIGSNKYGATKGERCNSIEEAEDQFLQIEHKWTAPLSAPTSNNTVMLTVQSSPVPNSCPGHHQPLLDINVSRGESPIEYQPCQLCAKIEQRNATEKSKISKNGTSPKKPVVIPHSLNRIPSAKASSSRV